MKLVCGWDEDACECIKDGFIGRHGSKEATNGQGAQAHTLSCNIDELETLDNRFLEFAKVMETYVFLCFDTISRYPIDFI